LSVPFFLWKKEPVPTRARLLPPSTAPLPASYPYRMDPGIRRIAICLLVPAAAGCAGSSHYRTAIEQDLRGDLRGAYRGYHEAYRRSGNPRHREARDRVGGQIAFEIREEALRLERSGDLDGAAADCWRALEYHPDDALVLADLGRVEDRRRGIEAALEEAGRQGGSWEAVDLLAGLRPESVARPDLALLAGRAAVRAADRDLTALLGFDLGLPSPEEDLPDAVDPPDGGPILASVEGDLARAAPASAGLLEERIAALRALEERTARAGADLGADPAAPGILGLLDLRRRAAREAAGLLEDAFAAERDRADGETLARAGDLAGALGAYGRSVLRWPWRPDVRDALIRTGERLESEASRAVLAAMARRDWEPALAILERLEGLLPGRAEVRQRAERCRREIQESLVREGARRRDRGLPGNALGLLLRARAAGAGGEELDREIARLEETIARRLDGEARLALPPEGEGRSGLADAVERRAVEGALCEAVAAAAPARRAAPGTALPGGPVVSGAVAIEVVSMAFDWREAQVTAGRVETRIVTACAPSRNPEWLLAREALIVADAEAARSREVLRDAGFEDRSSAAVRDEIAEGRRLRTQANLDRIPPLVPSLQWKSEVHPVTKVSVEASLTIVLGIDGSRRTVRAAMATEGREVEGDLERGIAPSTPHLPSRGAVLAALLERVAADLSMAAREALRDRRERLLDGALEEIAAGSCEAAVENVVLYLRGERGPRDGEAVELFQGLTGAAWTVRDGRDGPPAAGATGRSTRIDGLGK
jgi:tetratricopeptide (TPR) repeat protein